ncbi:MAG TPA: hypothetical protein VGT61_03150 [Thermomicrobiales bacterium]|jgi:hypothetical protein|nr:hypothetical protein [Thermomicrobiales bacterium]
MSAPTDRSPAPEPELAPAQSPAEGSDSPGRRRPPPEPPSFTRKLLVYSGITLLVVLIFVIAVRPILEARLVIIDYVVPASYSGWLVVAWDCEGGQDIDDLRTDGNRRLVTFDANGVACLLSPSPSPGYGIGSYRYPDGSEAPVRPGGSLDSTAYYAATPVAGTAPVPTTTGHTYNLASIGIGSEGSLGDRCDLEAFLSDRFGEPRSNWPCGPIEDDVEVVPLP